MYHIPIYYQILLAFLLDLLIGDPRFIIHPVTIIAKIASLLESIVARFNFINDNKTGSITSGSRIYKKEIKYTRTTKEARISILTGGACTITVYIVASGTIFLLRKLLGHYLPHLPILSDIFSIVIIYTTLATKSLYQHVKNVYLALKEDDLETARQKLSLIVGRDTKNLDRTEIIRGAVESAAESIVDGITSPIFFACLGGPELAILYKAVNTLDSMWGHKDEKYFNFGLLAAKIDDLFNYIPARITAPLMALSGCLIGGNFFYTLKIIKRDSRKHAGPNPGLSESAMAGTLKVRLGGINYYQGEMIKTPFIGEKINHLTTEHIKKSNELVLITSLLFLSFCLLFLFIK